MTFRRSTGVTLLSLATLSGLILASTVYRQGIRDWIALRNYQPSATVSQLSQDDQLTPAAQRVFYVAKPQIEAKETFRGHCPVEESTIVLGCFTGNNIYVLKVDDAQLDGIQQVTAAHEMLHAAYQRLSAGEKKRINALLQTAYTNQSNPRLKKTIDAYRSRDPNVVDNELHSILGTEVTSLSPELETYYSRYFKNRSVVVEYATKYEAVFTKFENDITAYDAQLESLKTQIDAIEPQISSAYTLVTTEQKRLDALYAAGRLAEYNDGVPAFNAQVRAYNKLVSQAKSLVDSYNQTVTSRNAIATSQADLNQKLNATYQTVETN